MVQPNPKTGLLVRYRTGRKAEAVDAVFEKLAARDGVTVKVYECGLSRRYRSHEEFPTANDYVPGFSNAGMAFVRWECID